MPQNLNPNEFEFIKGQGLASTKTGRVITIDQGLRTLPKAPEGFKFHCLYNDFSSSDRTKFITHLLRKKHNTDFFPFRRDELR